MRWVQPNLALHCDGGGHSDLLYVLVLEPRPGGSSFVDMLLHAPASSPCLPQAPESELEPYHCSPYFFLAKANPMANASLAIGKCLPLPVGGAVRLVAKGMNRREVTLDNSVNHSLTSGD